MAQYDGKIFGIGFYKTGTTTLYEALRLLGYRTVNGDTPRSYPGADDGETLIRQIDAGDYRLPTFEMFDAFTDNPYFRIWRQIYDLYPDAKYILTARDDDAWIDSCVKFYRNRRLRPMRLWMFGRTPTRPATTRVARRGSTRTASTTPRSASTSARAPGNCWSSTPRRPRTGDRCASSSRPRCRRCPGRTPMPRGASAPVAGSGATCVVPSGSSARCPRTDGGGRPQVIVSRRVRDHFCRKGSRAAPSSISHQQSCSLRPSTTLLTPNFSRK